MGEESKIAAVQSTGMLLDGATLASVFRAQPFTFHPDRPLIVTGLPRSGTSMVMQMLQVGGVPLLTDGMRPPDAFNPRGYFEYEPVKRLHRDSAWLREAGGRAVKIVAPLLPLVPPDIPCQVVFIRRDMEAVLSSQARMLGGAPPDAHVREAMEKALHQAREHLRRAGWPVLWLDYEEVLRAGG